MWKLIQRTRLTGVLIQSLSALSRGTAAQKVPPVEEALKRKGQRAKGGCWPKGHALSHSWVTWKQKARLTDGNTLQSVCETCLEICRELGLLDDDCCWQSIEQWSNLSKLYAGHQCPELACPANKDGKTTHDRQSDENVTIWRQTDGITLQSVFRFSR